MKVPVRLVGDFAEFTTKSGKKSFRAPVTFDDDGAKYPQGRGTVYASSPVDRKAVSNGLTARLISYDHGEARFAL